MEESIEQKVYNELGESISNKLKERHCTFIMNYNDLTFTFDKCPPFLISEIQELKELKGTDSVLKNYLPFLKQ